MDSYISQITFNYQIPVYWLFGGIATAIVGIAQVYGMFKSLIQRVDSVEKKHEMLDQIAQDVAYIKGKIEKQ